MTNIEEKQLVMKIRLNAHLLLETWGLPERVSKKEADAAKAKFFVKYPPRTHRDLARTVEDAFKMLERSGHITKERPESKWWRESRGEPRFRA
jgi:hypothetical protein